MSNPFTWIHDCRTERFIVGRYTSDGLWCTYSCHYCAASAQEEVDRLRSVNGGELCFLSPYQLGVRTTFQDQVLSLALERFEHDLCTRYGPSVDRNLLDAIKELQEKRKSALETCHAARSIVSFTQKENSNDEPGRQNQEIA